MKMGINVKGAEELITRLKFASKVVPDNARKKMHLAAKKIVQEAKLNAPVDDKELEDSIKLQVTYESKGRLAITISVGGRVRGVDVTKYAMLIHENYESMKPGPNTIAKRLSNPGRYIGSKFLDRAVESERARLIKGTIEAIKEGF